MKTVTLNHVQLRERSKSFTFLISGQTEWQLVRGSFYMIFIPNDKVLNSGIFKLPLFPNFKYRVKCNRKGILCEGTDDRCCYWSSFCSLFSAISSSVLWALTSRSVLLVHCRDIWGLRIWQRPGSLKPTQTAFQEEGLLPDKHHLVWLY